MYTLYIYLFYIAEQQKGVFFRYLKTVIMYS